MSTEAGSVQYHYGFYGAIHAQYGSENKDFKYFQELELGEEPVKLDMLIIKNASKLKLQDEIGRFFKTFNVFEYKSPDDGLSIDDFYKAQGYGCMYKAIGKKVNEIPVSEMTVSIFRHAYPREMLATLEEEGKTVGNPLPGVYYISGDLCIPTQVIVTSRLPEGKYEGLKILTKYPKREDVIAFLGIVNANQDPEMEPYYRAVVNVGSAANEQIYGEIKKEGIMGEAMERLFKEEIEEKKDEAREEVVEKMLEKKMAIDDIAYCSSVPLEKVVSIAKKLGYSTTLSL